MIKRSQSKLWATLTLLFVSIVCDANSQDDGFRGSESESSTYSPGNCQGIDTSEKAVKKSYEALKKGDWAKYTHYVLEEDLSLFKATFVQFILLYAPEEKPFFFQGMVYEREVIPKLPKEYIFEMMMNYFLESENPMAILHVINKVEIEEIILENDSLNRALVSEIYKEKDSSITINRIIEVIKSSGCWKVKLHPNIEQWRLATVDYIAKKKEKKK